MKTEYVRAYVPENETAARKNRDVSASYFIGKRNCYDSLSTGTPVVWNAQYSDELIYPNPSDGAVHISFTLAERVRLHLSVLDASGAVVRSLLAGDPVEAGAFQVVWDGRDGAGRALADGVYFWHLRDEAGGARSGKVVLARR